MFYLNINVNELVIPDYGLLTHFIVMSEINIQDQNLK